MSGDPQRSTSRVRRGVFAVVALVFAGANAAADEPPKTPLEDLKKTIDLAGLPAMTRMEAAKQIAEEQYAPDVLVPWLRERLAKEESFHVRIGLAYAIAAQGEVEGLQVLVDSLSETGHLGYVFLARVSGEDFGNSDVGWNKPAWDAWLAKLDASAWREEKRLKHLPRRPLDDDEAGFAKAIAWWDGLGYPDVGKLPCVRVTVSRGVWPESLRKEFAIQKDSGEYAFLLREDATTLTVFDADLAERTYPRAAAENAQSAAYSRCALPEDVAKDLAQAEAKEDRTPWSRDPFGLTSRLSSRLRRHAGFILARTLAAHGEKDLALKVWKHLAAAEPFLEPRHGPWSCLALLKEDAAKQARLAWEAESRATSRAWTESLVALRRWRARFPADSRSADDEAILARMAAEEAAYAPAAASEAADPAERARALVFALPTVARTLGYAWGAPPRTRLLPEDPPDALSRLVAIGYPAIPVLRGALADRRLTKSVVEVWNYGLSMSTWPDDPRPVTVRDLAVVALREITLTDFPAKEEEADTMWKAVAAQVDAWWDAFEKKGERAMLEAGVQTRTSTSVAQARRLVERHPDSALAVVRAAVEGAEPKQVAELLEALEGLARPDAQEYLLEHARAGPLAARIAAARALLAQGRREGLTSLIDDWPVIATSKEVEEFWGEIALRELIATLFVQDPLRSFPRVRETVRSIPPAVQLQVLGELGSALRGDGFQSDDRLRHGPQPREAWDAAESLVVALVLDENVREDRDFTPAASAAQRIGESAAQKAAELWPDRYVFRRDASARDRLTTRHAIVDSWRKRAGLAPLAPPVFANVEPVAAEAAKPLIDAWLAAKDDVTRTGAESAIVVAGLGMLPHLSSARATLAAGDARIPPLEFLTQRVACIVREIVWSPKSPKRDAAIDAYVEAIRARPLTGAWIVGLWATVVAHLPEGATGIDLLITRFGDGTGVVLALEMTVDVSPWPGDSSGWIFWKGEGATDGECADDDDVRNLRSWWHGCRGPQADGPLLVPPTDELRIHWRMTRGHR